MSIIQLSPVLSLVHLNQMARMLILIHIFRPIPCHMSIIQLSPVLSLVHLNQMARMLILLYDLRPKLHVLFD